MKKVTLILCAIFLIAPVGAQSFAVKDSLLFVLGQATTDSIKVEILEDLAMESYYTDPSEAIGYCLQMKDISERSSFKYGQAMSYGWLAYLYEQRGDVDEAILYNKKSVALLIEIGDKKNLAACYNNLGAIYKDRGQIDLALEYHTECLKLRIETKNAEGVSVTLNNIGFIYYGQGRIKEALLYYRKSLEIAEYVKDWPGVAVSMSNIADVYVDLEQTDYALDYHFKALNIYNQIDDLYGKAFTLNSIGNIYESQNKDDLALDYFLQARKIRDDIEDIQGLGFVLVNIGNIYFKQGKYELAIDNYVKARKYLESVEDPLGLANVTLKLSEVYLALGDPALAKKYATESLEYSNLLKFPKNIRNATESLYLISSKQKDWENALINYKTYIVMRDSLVNEDNKKAAVLQKLEYEFDRRSLEERLIYEKKKKVQEANLQKQKIALLLTAGILLLIVILFIAIYIGKKRSDHLLLNILPYETAQELKRKGMAKTRKYNQVTVLFTDFKGFTTFAEKLSAEELVEEINVCFSEFDRIIEKHKIEKIKTIGDAYMAAGGLPTPTETHAHDTVKAALEIKEFIDELGRKRKAEGKESFEIRIGIHTGPVVAGIVGIKKFAYDIWGDTVNTASRMESSGSPGKVNVSDSTYELIKDEFNCEYRGKVEAKNKGMIDMYFVS